MACLRARLAVIRAVTGCLRGALAHVLPGLGVAIVAVAGAMVDLGRGVDPDLTGAAAPCGLRGRCCGLGCRWLVGRRRGRRGCHRRRSTGGGAECLDALVSSAGTAALRSGPGCSVLAGCCDGLCSGGTCHREERQGSKRQCAHGSGPVLMLPNGHASLSNRQGCAPQSLSTRTRAWIATGLAPCQRENATRLQCVQATTGRNRHKMASTSLPGCRLSPICSRVHWRGALSGRQRSNMVPCRNFPSVTWS